MFDPFKPEINKVWAMPNAWTFKIKPIRELLSRYVGDGRGWIDPFAGDNSPAELTNDIHPDRKAMHHMEALDFLELLSLSKYNGIIFDPPYSFTQIKEHYLKTNKFLPKGATNMQFYSNIKNKAKDMIKLGGYAISFGWNSNGFGKSRGFAQVEILLVAHGGHKNDTIVTVERKIENV